MQEYIKEITMACEGYKEEESMKLPISGYSALTQTIGEDELVWRSQEEDGEVMPDIYNTVAEVEKEIVEDQMEELQQYLDGNRKYDEISWEPDSYPVYIEIDEQEIIRVWTDDHTEHLLLEITLKEWRAQL